MCSAGTAYVCQTQKVTAKSNYFELTTLPDPYSPTTQLGL